MQLREVVTALETWFPVELAEPWDVVGLTFGDLDAQVESMLVAIDPSREVVDEAIAYSVDLLVTHHPLWLSGVTDLRGPKGLQAQYLLSNEIALYNAHTNADRAQGGVNDALAAALGLQDVRPLEQVQAEFLRVTVYVPGADRERLIDALSAAGAGTIGEYERCGYSVAGTGTFRPVGSANPHIGEVGRIEQVAEDRLEMILPPGARAAVERALLQIHPYEEPAYDFTSVSKQRVGVGLGRVGHVPPQTLPQFAAHVGRCLPRTAAGVRFAGDSHRTVQTVAVVGGSGTSELAAASAVADVLVTADSKHHVIDEHIAAGGCAVVDVAHWASEWPWCDVTARRLSDLGLRAWASEVVTDPWIGHVGGTDEG